jgi:hypothetical protein
VKRTTVIIAVLIMLGLMGSASAQSLLPVPRAANPPTVIPGPLNDNMVDAFTLYPDVSLIVEGIDTATVEIDEVAHACALPAATAGSHSVWFAAYLPKGLLTLKTEGTAYVTAGDPSNDTVMSVYRLTDKFAPDFTKLEALTCANGGTGAAQINELPTNDAIYLIQVSMESGTALAGSTLSLKAKFKPASPVAGDKPSNARPLTFPATYLVNSLSSATVDFNEPIDPMVPAEMVGNSIWYKFQLAAPQRVLLGSLLGPVSIFRVLGNGTLEPIDYTFIDIDDLALLEAGNYLVRVFMPAIQMPLLALGALIPMPFIAVPVLSPTNVTFGTDEGTVDAVASLDGWKLKSATPSGEPNADELVCGFIADKCGVQFTSQGAGEATKLVGKTSLSSIKLKKGELLLLAATGMSTDTSTQVRVKLILRDATGARVIITKDLVPGTFGILLDQVVAMPRKFTPVSAKIVVTNLSQTEGNVAIIDELLVVTARVLDPARGNVDTIGLIEHVLNQK